MASHKKPSQKELDQQIKKTVEKAKNDKKKDEEQQKEVEKEADKVLQQEQTEVEEDDQETEEEDQEEDDQETEEEDQETEEDDQETKKESDQVDYKKKFSESSKENQKIYAKNRKITKAVNEGMKIKPPSDEKMAEIYPEWDDLNNFEKRIAKQNYVQEQKDKLLEKAITESEKIEKWNEQVEEFIKDPKTLNKYQELEGKEEDFRFFATRQENNSVPFDILVKSFLYENATNKTKKKGKMFESASGGAKTKPKKDKVSLAQAEVLRETNYDKYKKLLKEGKIDFTNV